MANWKKMAEAFGRAVTKPRQANDNTKAAFKSFDRDVANYVKDPEAAARAEAFNKGVELGRMDETDIRKELGTDQWRANRNDIVGKRRDELEDAATDAALVENREKEWDDAFKSAKEHVKRGYGGSYPEDMASEGADAFEKQLWDVIDELKAQGRSVEDILGALKSMGQK